MTNLLLLFSAMLSALIGAGPVARAAPAPVAVASVAAEQAVPVAAERISARPLAPRIGIAAMLCVGMIVLSAAQGTIPAWKTRRRE